jgi:hypothetical protein
VRASEARSSSCCSRQPWFRRWHQPGLRRGWRSAARARVGPDVPAGTTCRRGRDSLPVASSCRSAVIWASNAKVQRLLPATSRRRDSMISKFKSQSLRRSRRSGWIQCSASSTSRVP